MTAFNPAIYETDVSHYPTAYLEAVLRELVKQEAEYQQTHRFHGTRAEAEAAKPDDLKKASYIMGFINDELANREFDKLRHKNEAIDIELAKIECLEAIAKKTYLVSSENGPLMKVKRHYLFKW